MSDVRRDPMDQRPLPHVDDDGLLRLGDEWVAIPDAQLPVVTLLVESFGRLVSRDEIVGAYVAAGHSGLATSIRSLLARVGRRVAGLGLELHTVRGTGVLLRHAEPAR